MIANAEVAMCWIKTSINQMANYIAILEIQDIGPQKITLSFKINLISNICLSRMELAYSDVDMLRFWMYEVGVK